MHHQIRFCFVCIYINVLGVYLSGHVLGVYLCEKAFWPNLIPTKCSCYMVYAHSIIYGMPILYDSMYIHPYMYIRYKISTLF